MPWPPNQEESSNRVSDRTPCLHATMFTKVAAKRGPADRPGPAMPVLRLALLAVAGLANAQNDVDFWSVERPSDMADIDSLDVMRGKTHMEVQITFDRPYNGIIFSKGAVDQYNCIYVKPQTRACAYSFDTMFTIKMSGNKMKDDIYKGLCRAQKTKEGLVAPSYSGLGAVMLAYWSLAGSLAGAGSRGVVDLRAVCLWFAAEAEVSSSGPSSLTSSGLERSTKGAHQAEVLLRAVCLRFTEAAEPSWSRPSTGHRPSIGACSQGLPPQ